VLEEAARQRQELLDGQPDHLDYRSEVAGCWNDIGLALYTLRRSEEALAAHERAVAMQEEVVAAAPQVPRYRRLLCNHHFNLATDLRELGRPAEAIAAVGACCRLEPHDPEQWVRQGRVLASLADQPSGAGYADAALAALRRARELGYDPAMLRNFRELRPLQSRPEFRALLGDPKHPSADMPQPP
jgi:tetratricopeptide (TPR) repeat protein